MYNIYLTFSLATSYQLLDAAGCLLSKETHVGSMPTILDVLQVWRPPGSTG
jgi:hypothetical protein